MATLNISMGLAELGHEVVVLGMNTSKHYSQMEEIPPYVNNLIDIKDVKIDTDVNLWKASINLLFSDMPYNATRFFSRRFEQSLEEILNKQQFDIIQMEGLYMCWYIPVIRKNSKAKISLRAHNLEHEIWERSANLEKSPIKKKYFKILSKRIKKFEISNLNKYDILIPITRRDSGKYKKLGNRLPTHVSPVGYDMSDIGMDKENFKFPSLFFIGTLDWFPNQEGLIWFLDHVWEEVLELNPGLSFHIAGRNAPGWLKKLFRKKQNVVFHGEVNDARQFIRENAIMIAPLFSGSGMRVKIIEGMALGKAIVTTTIGAEGIDLVSDHNIIIEDLAMDFITQIDALVKDKDKYIRIGKNATRFIKDHYDNKDISGKLASFYSKQIQSVSK